MNANEIKSVCISNLSNEQLDNLVSDLIKEQNKRKNIKRQRAWDKVIKALQEYMAEYGEIRVYDDDSVDIHLTFLDLETDTIGELHERLW